MKPLFVKRSKLIVSLFALALGATIVTLLGRVTAQVAQEATNSSPIAISATGDFLWVVNQDNNSVSVIDVRNDSLKRVAEIAVGQEPRTVALTPDGRFALVTNMVDGTVSVIDASAMTVTFTIPVGVEPYGVAVAPDGAEAWVANASSDSVSVIETATWTVVDTIQGVGRDPRGVAFANNDKVYVTQFFSRPRSEAIPGDDDENEGVITVIDRVSRTVTGEVVFPTTLTGFSTRGDAIRRIPPTEGDPIETRAYPNQLQFIAILGDYAYLPNTAASPNGPVVFNVNTQGFLSVFNINTDTWDPDRSINLNRGIGAEAREVPEKRFMASPWAIAFKHAGNPGGGRDGYAVLTASDIAVKVEIAPDGTPTINPPTNIKRTVVGSAPRGIVINPSDTRAYVLNYVSRDVSVIDLTTETATSAPRVIASIRSAQPPIAGTDDAIVHEGRRLFFTSIGGVFNDTDGTRHFRMSSEGWQSCLACHEDGRDDKVVWMFAAGPRRTVDLSGSFSHLAEDRSRLPSDPLADQRWLNWTAIFDEPEDFELNTRGVSGANIPMPLRRGGLLTLPDHITPDATANIRNFRSGPPGPPTNGTRDQVQIFDGVRLINTQNAIAMFMQRGIRARIAPESADDPQVMRGRELFEIWGCVQCHAGPKWSTSTVRVRPPNPGDDVVEMRDGVPIPPAQFQPVLRNVGTFDPNGRNEVNGNAGRAQGGFGFNPPSLLGVFSNKRFFHNGEVLSLEELLRGVGCVDPDPTGCAAHDFSSFPEEDRAAAVKFLRSIDERTPFFPASAPAGGNSMKRRR